jgi:hypothetical protein
MTEGIVHDGRTFSAAKTMGSFVIGVGFNLDDPARTRSDREDGSDQFLRNEQSVSRKELFCK